MHPSIAEQVASMHKRELLDRSQRHFRLAGAGGHVSFGDRLRMALSRRKRGTRGQVVPTLGGEIAGSELARPAAAGGPPPKKLPPGVTGRQCDLTGNVTVHLIRSRPSRNES